MRDPGYLKVGLGGEVWPGEPLRVINLDDLVKSHEINYRWLSKKVHIRGVVFFQERGHTCSLPSV